MKCHGFASLHDLLGDFVAFRNLDAADLRLPRYADIAPSLGLSASSPPRKCDPTYGWVVARLLREARALEPSRPPIERLMFVGDTLFNDGAAFTSIADAGGWTGVAFIGRDAEDPRELVETRYGDRLVLQANRWEALLSIDGYCADRAFPVDDRTAIVFDIDKTTLGARGRNDASIDQARVAAAQRTAVDLLGEAFDASAFEMAYTKLGEETYVGFTRDNQDVLVYLCLIVAAGILGGETLGEWIVSRRLVDFPSFLAWVDQASMDLPARLREEHVRVRACVARGDATPFKAFRRNEYRETVTRMQPCEDGSSVAAALAREIVMTDEVRRVAQAWKDRGAVLFGLSDKPDEACYPSADMEGGELLPLHRSPARLIGVSCRPRRAEVPW